MILVQTPEKVPSAAQVSLSLWLALVTVTQTVHTQVVTGSRNILSGAKLIF